MSNWKYLGLVFRMYNSESVLWLLSHGWLSVSISRDVLRLQYDAGHDIYLFIWSGDQCFQERRQKAEGAMAAENGNLNSTYTSLTPIPNTQIQPLQIAPIKSLLFNFIIPRTTHKYFLIPMLSVLIT